MNVIKKMKWLSVLFFLIITTIVLAESLPYVDAGSKEGQIQSVEVSGNTSTPVVLKKGTTYVITVKFKCLADVTSANVYARFIIGGVPMPFAKGELEAISYPLKMVKIM